LTKDIRQRLTLVRQVERSYLCFGGDDPAEATWWREWTKEVFRYIKVRVRQGDPLTTYLSWSGRRKEHIGLKAPLPEFPAGVESRLSDVLNRHGVV